MMTRIENAPGNCTLPKGAKVAGLADAYTTLCRCGFTLEELAALQHYCLKYSALVRSGGTPTPEQNARFMRYSAVCYRTGAAYVK